MNSHARVSVETVPSWVAEVVSFNRRKASAWYRQWLRGGTAGVVSSDNRRCVFCLKEIRPGASVCPHCRSNLAPLQDLADKNTLLEQRLAALEQVVAKLQATQDDEVPGRGLSRPARIRGRGP
jgi:hypothetical protein